MQPCQIYRPAKDMFTQSSPSQIRNLCKLISSSCRAENEVLSEGFLHAQLQIICWYDYRYDYMILNIICVTYYMMPFFTVCS